VTQVKARFTLHADQYGVVVVEADGKVHTRQDADWYLRADAPDLAKGETIAAAAWSPQMGVLLTTSAGRVLSHNLGHLASWRAEA
jgi:hypothetical protein